MGAAFPLLFEYNFSVKMAEPVQFGQFVVVFQAEVLETSAYTVEIEGLPLLQPLADHRLHLLEFLGDGFLLLAEYLGVNFSLHPLQLLPHDQLQLVEGHFVGQLDVAAGSFVVGDVVLENGLLAHRTEAEDNWDLLPAGVAVVLGVIEADEDVGAAGTFDQELVLDHRTGELPIVLSGESLEEDALLGAVADLAIDLGPSQSALADASLPNGGKLAGGDDILTVLAVFLLESLQLEFGAVGLVGFLRPEGGFVFLRGFVGSAGLVQDALVGESQFPFDGVFDVVLLVDLRDVGLEEAIVDACIGRVSEVRFAGRIGGESGHALEGVAFGGAEADLVVLLLEKVVDPTRESFLGVAHCFIAGQRQSQMGNEVNCNNFCCEPKSAIDKPAEDVVLSEFILACQICGADVKHPKFKDHLDLVHFSEIEEVEGSIYVKCILCGKRADSLDKHGEHIKSKHPYAVSAASTDKKAEPSKADASKSKEPKDFAKIETVNGSTLVTCQLCGKQKESLEKHNKHFMKEHAAVLNETLSKDKKQDKKDKKEKGSSVMEDISKEVKPDPMLHRVKKQMSTKLESQTDFQIVKSSEDGKIMFAAVKGASYQVEMITKEYRGADYDPDDVDAELGWFSVFKSTKRVRYFYIDVEPKEKSIVCKAFLFKEK